MIVHIEDPIFNYFQGYLGIFRNIDAYPATITDVQLGVGGVGGTGRSKRREVSSALCENQKGFPDFGKKIPDCAHL